MSTAPPPLPAAAETLARIEVKVDLLLKGTDDHEKRIRALEALRVPRPVVNMWLTGIASAAAVVTVLTSLYAH